MSRGSQRLLRQLALLGAAMLFMAYVWPTMDVTKPGGWEVAKERLIAFITLPFETNSETHETKDLAHRADLKGRERKIEERIRELNQSRNTN